MSKIFKDGSNNAKPVTKKGKSKNVSSYDLGTKEWEDVIMFPLKIMKVYLIVYLACAILIPIYKGSGIFIDSFSTILVMLLLSLGLASCYGRFVDFTPMLGIALIRGVHFLLNAFVFKKEINYLFWGLLILLELGLSFYYLVDKSRYECVTEKEIKDEFY